MKKEIFLGFMTFLVKEVGNLAVIAYNGSYMAADNTQPAKKAGDGARQSGPEDRFLKAFDEYSDALFRHAMYRLSDRERAIEIVHDTFTKVWGYLRNGHEIDSYKSFLYKVTNNLIIDEYRRRKETSLDAILSEEGMDEGKFLELHGGGLEEITFSMDAKRALDLLPDLPVVYREVIILRYVDGLGPKEISDLIEESENVVSVRLHRALRLLKERMLTAEEEILNKRIKKSP